MSRPKPEILLEKIDKETYKTEQILASAGIWSVYYQGRAINLKTQNMLVSYPGPKYKKVSFSNISVTKKQYTNAFVKHGKLEVPIDEQYQYFWQNIRETGGLRLNENGYHFVNKTLEIENWSVDIRQVKVSHKFLLELDRFMNCPYYIVTGRWPKIIIFSEQTYFWLVMHNKDFERFLNGYKK